MKTLVKMFADDSIHGKYTKRGITCAGLAEGYMRIGRLVRVIQLSRLSAYLTYSDS